MHGTSIVATCYHHLRPTKVNAQQDKLDRRWTTKLTILGMVDGQCLFQASFFFGGGSFPPPKNSIPFKHCQIACSRSFFRSGHCITNTPRKLSVNGQQTQKIISHSAITRIKNMPKMQQNTFGGRAPPGPAGRASALPQSL